MNRAVPAWFRALLAAWILGLAAGDVSGESFSEGFEQSPRERGWEIVGDATLFRWDAAAGGLGVTWDSSRSNSFFLRRLAAPVTPSDDFAFGFDLTLSQHAVGTAPGKPGTFQIAMGLINVADAMDPGFQRGVFLRSRNLVEWTWFAAQPDGAIAASLSPAIVPADGRLPWGYSDSFVQLETGVRYGFGLRYTATNRTLRIAMTADGVALPDPAPVVLPRSFTRFRVDALSIHSYSDAGQDPRYAGSVHAVGIVDDVWWQGPGSPVGPVRLQGQGSGRRVVTATRSGWVYWLEGSDDLKGWGRIGAEVPGTGGDVAFEDPETGGGEHRFYRVGGRLP